MQSRNWGLIAGVVLVVGAVLLGIALIWRGGPQATVPVTPGVTEEAASEQANVTASPRPTVSPTLPPPVTYVVEGGDTLSGIAQAYDISLEALIAANDIENPDVLQVGQTLVIPQGETAASRAVPSTAAPAQTSSAEERDYVEPPTLTPSGPPLVEIRAVLNVGDLAGETVILENRGGTVSLEAWTLSAAGDATFVFPALTLFPQATVRVHSANGQDAPGNLYWGRSEGAWEVGQLVTLRNADGNVVDTYIIPES